MANRAINCETDMDSTALYTALQGFANAATTKTTQITSGAPEDQLRAPFEAFMAAAGQARQAAEAAPIEE